MKLEELKGQLANKHVGIAGAGGLGSNCASALTRCGVGRLTLADFDVVDESNLNRQFYFTHQIGCYKVDALKENLLMINPHLQVNIFKGKLNHENIPHIFAHVDVLVEAFDLAEQKAIIIETALETWPERPIIAGSGMAGFGQIQLLRIRQLGNLYICGDEESEISESLPPIAPRVGIVAHMQADKVIELLANL